MTSTVLYYEDKASASGDDAPYIYLKKYLPPAVHMINMSYFEAHPEKKADVFCIVTMAAYSANIMHVVSQMNNLILVAYLTSGTDHLDKGYCASRDIQILSNAPLFASVVSDYTLMLMMASSRMLKLCEKSAREASLFQYKSSIRGRCIAESTVGIIGMGEIGISLSRKLLALEAKVLYYSPNRKSLAIERQLDIGYVSDLMSMLPYCDTVVICCPLAGDNFHMFSETQFMVMKDSAHLINVGRGGIVDTNALLTALENKEIAGAALDVTDPEPLPTDHPLLHMDNVIVTGHQAWATDKILFEAAEVTMAGVKKALDKYNKCVSHTDI